MKKADDEQLAAWLLEALERGGEAGLSLRQLLSLGGLGTDQRRRLRRLLRSLQHQGRVVALERRRFGLATACECQEGVVSDSGRRWLRVDTGTGPLLVRSDLAGGAQLGDRVRVCVSKKAGGRKVTVRIEQILERHRRPLVGTLRRRGRFALLMPDDGRADPVVVEGLDVRRVHDGQVIAVQLPEGARPVARLLEVLGEAGSFDCELRRLKIVHGLERSFSREVLAEAEAVSAGPDPASRRLDLTHLPHLTIDPDDAQDFDDAIWLQAVDGGYRLLVSIADVASFVPAGGFLDREAARRGCSVYLPGEAVPMLPPLLSEGLCSLVPGERRRAQTVEMFIDGAGRVSGCRLWRTLIRSAARLTYRQVQRVLDGEKDVFAAPFRQVLFDAAECARLLLGQLKQRGMLDLDVPESEISLGPGKRPLEVRPAERLFSHRLIETMMIAANEQVAEFMQAVGAGAVYRVHPPPDAEKMLAFRQLAQALGQPADFSENPRPVELGRYLSGLEGPRRAILSQLLLRSLMQASYCERCEPHFGLASKAYLHFTSPIRRYPDLIVHRQLAAMLEAAEAEGLDVARPQPALGTRLEREALAALAAECTAAERRAMTAERDAKALYHAAFMQEKVGETFSGQVSFVADFGLFVTVWPYGIEGLLHVTAMKDDYYRYLPDRLCLEGHRRHRRFAVGDSVRVRVEAARLWPPQIELSLAEQEVG